MTRSPFSARSPFPVLARIPLLPAADSQERSPRGDALLAEGMFLASRQLDPEADLPGRDRSRLAITRRGYEIRAQWRPVPHLVFAGVALARFTGQGETPSLRLGAGHRARTNPSAAWLAAVRDQILTDPAVLSALRLTTSNLVTHRGPRLEHERPASSGARPQRVSVRATEATALIMSLCAAGASASQIPAKVVERWKVPDPLVRAMLTELVRDAFLLTDLLPGDLTVDPLGHLVDKLTPGHRLRTSLTRLRRLLADADRYRPGDPVRLDTLMEARNLVDQISFCERPLTADAVADAHVVLPAALAGEVATAAGVLWRAGCGQGPLTRYHERFLERYGIHRYVPLLDVTDPAIGLGIDAATPDRDPVDLPDRRTKVLASLLGRATANGGVEVVLDDADLTELTGGQPGLPPPRTAEMCVRVIAATPEDLAAGRLRLAVCPGGSPEAGTALGRFTGLLHIAGQDCDDAGLVAEVVARPRVAEGLTLAPPTGLTPQRIPVGVPAEPGDLPLDDLSLVSDGHRLILWSFSQDRQVIPVLYSRLTSHLLPPLARFLQLVGRTGCRPLHGWSWEPAGGGPFTPRVRYRRTILASARWVLPPTLTRMTHDQAAWSVALTRWRAETVPAPPDLIVVDDGDRSLPLDLRRADDRELLRRYAGRGVAAVTEPPGGPGAIQAVLPGPAGRHLLELVVPLARRETVPPPVRRAVVRARDTGLYLPGGWWLSLAIRTPAGELLLPGLATLAGDLAGHYDIWFWLRYHTPENGPHIRARFCGDPATLGSRVLPAFCTWGREMIRQRCSGGFTVEPYDQEIERYGGAAAIGAAEQVFAADSSLALAILASVSDRDQRLIIAALSAAAIARPMTDAYQAALNGGPLDRTARRQMLDLRPQVRAARGQITAGPDLGGIRSAWSARRDVLATYRDLLDPARRADCTSSLIHLHLNRLFGDLRSERIVRALAADLLATPS
ncbi:MAG: lantibiotic dehydratase [Pseudonocardiales bacterium]|nr:lantibiotic dehydratase [Pseudonocardiales bacterium]